MHAVDSPSAPSRQTPPAVPPVRPSRGKGAKRPRPRRTGGITPLLLALPTLIFLFGLLGYPLVKMILLSFQDMKLRHLFNNLTPPWAGWDNYTKILFNDPFFWVVVRRTVYFTAVSVFLTVVLGLAIALLMRRVSKTIRMAMIVTMMFVWAIPQLVAATTFKWLIDTDFGVVNYLIDQIPGVDFTNHSWFAKPWQGWIVITAIVIWAGIPFIAITLNAGLTQVPKELLEAATVDGASTIQALRNITLPILRPLITIVTTLSIIWNFGLFTQPWVVRNGKPEDDYHTLATWAYRTAFQNNNYSLGAAISVITVILMLGVMTFYVRQMFKIGEVD
jgi:N,N'-diacetylchitobiose transport system permease protein